MPQPLWAWPSQGHTYVNCDGFVIPTSPSSSVGTRPTSVAPSISLFTHYLKSEVCRCLSSINTTRYLKHDGRLESLERQETRRESTGSGSWQPTFLWSFMNANQPGYWEDPSVSPSCRDEEEAQRTREDESPPTLSSGGEAGAASHSSDDNAEVGQVRSTAAEHGPPPHQSVGFWHRGLDAVRRDVVRRWLLTTAVLLLFIVGILSLFWGVLFAQDEKTRSLVVYVVDFDGQAAPYDSVTPFVGPIVTRTARQLLEEPGPSLGYTVVPASHFRQDPLAVRRAVYDWECYAAIYVNPNATALLREAVAVGNASYDPRGSLQFVLLSARDQTTYESVVYPHLASFAQAFSAAFGPAWARAVATNASWTRDHLAAASTAVNPGISPLVVDLRPFQPPAATPSVSIGLIYLIIMAFFSFSFFLPIHMNFVIPRGHPPLHFWQLILWRLFSTVLAYFFISLAYSLVSLAFRIPFRPPPASPVEPPPPQGATAYGRGSFLVYWMVNFVGMNALGLACENVAMLLGQPWTALWLIFWVITNVSTSFYSLDLAPGFYRWGYAWPLRHIVAASRQILFDLRSQIGLNLGVLFAWAAVNIALFPLCCYYMRWKGEREKRREEVARDRYVVKTEGGDEKELPKQVGQKPPIRKRGFWRGV
ncbi:hypothetical protein VTK73DRAFT_7919 [Phialemonium thermophilum]|uniref:DUF3533 domain-containing protein n=1 Tax=Phialemonium thermophilum TaxID=223376 RepID=A0ABR3WBU2_9PEZI